MASRRSLILARAAMLAACLAGCREQPDEKPSTTGNELETVLPLPPPPAPTLDRARLLDAIRAAASAHSAGTDDRAAQRALAGRRFSIRLPFACPGLTGANGSQYALTVRRDGRSFELRATPSLTADDAKIAGSAAPLPEGVEGIEGFWIDRPWLLTDTCPQPPQAPPPKSPQAPATEPSPAPSQPEPEAAPQPPEAERTAGVVQILSKDDSRVGQRSGRDYRVVVRLAEDEAPPEQLALVIDGRLRPWPGGRVIRCFGDDARVRPACVAGADIDRVAFVRSDTGEVLSEWVK